MSTRPQNSGRKGACAGYHNETYAHAGMRVSEGTYVLRMQLVVVYRRQVRAAQHASLHAHEDLYSRSSAQPQPLFHIAEPLPKPPPGVNHG